MKLACPTETGRKVHGLPEIKIDYFTSLKQYSVKQLMFKIPVGYDFMLVSGVWG